jgi:hypothetical protein
MPFTVIPYAVKQLDRGLRRVLRGFGGVPLLAFVLLAVAAIPPVIEASEQQPLLQSVDQVRDGVSRLAGWVRIRGDIVTLSPQRDVEANYQVFSLLVEESGDAIMLLSGDPVDHLDEITGRLGLSGDAGESSRNIGGPRFPAGEIDVVDSYIVRVDDPVVPPENRSWLLVWVLIGVAGGLLVAYRIGYPVVRVRRDAAIRAPAAARPLGAGEEMAVRLVEPQEETGPKLQAPSGRLRRLPRNDPADPYFELVVDGQPRPIQFRRHRWSRAMPGSITTLGERLPIVHLHDWGIEVMLALASETDRDRLLASFAIGEGEDEVVEVAEPAHA